MARCLITGATGFVGREACRLFASRGWEVRAAVRGPGAVPPAASLVVVGDIGARTDWSAALDHVDVVVHLAARVHVMRDRAADPLAANRAVNRDATATLAQAAAAAGVRRFVFVSTAKVNGERTEGRAVRGSDPPDPHGPYAVSKLEAEEAVRAAARATMDWVVLRPPLVYGPGVGGNMKRLVDWVHRGVPLPFRLVNNRRSLIGRGNLADALEWAASAPIAGNRTLVVCDGPAWSTREVVERIGAVLGRRPLLLPVPAVLLRSAAGLLGRRADVDRLLDSFVLDPEEAAAAGWRAPINPDDELRRTADWVLGRGESVV